MLFPKRSPHHGFGPRMLFVLATVAAIVALGGCGEQQTASHHKRHASRATAASFSSCLKSHGVALHPSGAIPGDERRTRFPIGWKLPSYVPPQGEYAGAKYLGAVTFKTGGFFDVWIVRSASVASDLASGISDEPDAVLGVRRAARRYLWQNNRNLIMSDDQYRLPKFNDNGAKWFDHCLSHAQPQ